MGEPNTGEEMRETQNIWVPTCDISYIWFSLMMVRKNQNM